MKNAQRVFPLGTPMYCAPEVIKHQIYDHKVFLKAIVDRCLGDRVRVILDDDAETTFLRGHSKILIILDYLQIIP